MPFTYACHVPPSYVNARCTHPAPTTVVWSVTATRPRPAVPKNNSACDDIGSTHSENPSSLVPLLPKIRRKLLDTVGIFTQASHVSVGRSNPELFGIVTVPVPPSNDAVVLPSPSAAVSPNVTPPLTAPAWPGPDASAIT